jgi:hypothetical protein
MGSSHARRRMVARQRSRLNGVTGSAARRFVGEREQRGSALLVRVEDVVFRLHGRMARVSAVRGACSIG